MENVGYFLHSGNIGDVWASIPAMKEFSKKSNKKIVLFLEKDRKAIYYEGATHPTKNDNGEDVMLNEAMINMMIPLLKAQSFIEDVKIWDNEQIHVDLNRIRDTNVGMPNFSINRWYFYVYPDLACDLTKQWLEVPDSEKDIAKGKVIITRSERYRNQYIDYSFIKEYQDDCLFIGTMKEYNNFCMTYDLQIKKLHINNFLEEAQAIKQCKFHLSNQTQAFQLSEGQRTPRLLELCEFAPNVLVNGEDAYDFLSQVSLEYYFKILYNKKPAK